MRRWPNTSTTEHHLLSKGFQPLEMSSTWGTRIRSNYRWNLPQIQSARKERLLRTNRPPGTFCQLLLHVVLLARLWSCQDPLTICRGTHALCPYGIWQWELRRMSRPTVGVLVTSIHNLCCDIEMCMLLSALDLHGNKSRGTFSR